MNNNMSKVETLVSQIYNMINNDNYWFCNKEGDTIIYIQKDERFISIITQDFRDKYVKESTLYEINKNKDREIINVNKIAGFKFQKRLLFEHESFRYTLYDQDIYVDIDDNEIGVLPVININTVDLRFLNDVYLELVDQINYENSITNNTNSEFTDNNDLPF